MIKSSIPWTNTNRVTFANAGLKCYSQTLTWRVLWYTTECRVCYTCRLVLGLLAAVRRFYLQRSRQPHKLKCY